MEWSTTTKCTVALIATMLGGTYWLVNTIEKASPSGSEYDSQLLAIRADLEGISHGIGEVEGNTQSIDRRLMSPEERFKDLQRRLPANAK
jgi:hypothetical protein